MKIYTRTGDDGTTGLSGGQRASKHDARIQAMGDLDELNATLGWCQIVQSHEPIRHVIDLAQSQLFEIGAELSCPPDGRVQYAKIADENLTVYEESIDALTAELEPLTHFILPGGSEAGARLHIARTVCRRAERSLVALATDQPVRPVVLSLVNRLSDWLFVAARTANRVSLVKDVKWMG